jgi:hypothetical protein
VEEMAAEEALVALRVSELSKTSSHRENMSSAVAMGLAMLLMRGFNGITLSRKNFSISEASSPAICLPSVYILWMCLAM